MLSISLKNWNFILKKIVAALPVFDHVMPMLV